MTEIAPISFAADPYFADIICEMEAIEPRQGEHGASRRQFLKLTGGAGVGLVLAFSVGGFAKSAQAATNAAGEAVFNAYIRIAPSGSISMTNPESRSGGDSWTKRPTSWSASAARSPASMVTGRRVARCWRKCMGRR